MGATDYLFRYQTDDTEKVSKAFAKAVPSECDEDGEGNSYCGCPCQSGGEIARFRSEPFATEAEAREWILDNTEKREAAFAAAYYLPAKVSDKAKAKLDVLRAKQATEHQRVDERIAVEIKKMVEAKSKTVTCTGCSSRLARKHLNGSLRGSQADGRCGCPLCGTPLLSPSALKTITSARARLVKANKAVTKASAPKATKKVGYAVGGWAAE